MKEGSKWSVARRTTFTFMQNVLLDYFLFLSSSMIEDGRHSLVAEYQTDSASSVVREKCMVRSAWMVN